MSPTQASLKVEPPQSLLVLSPKTYRTPGLTPWMEFPQDAEPPQDLQPLSQKSQNTHVATEEQQLAAEMARSTKPLSACEVYHLIKHHDRRARIDISSIVLHDFQNVPAIPRLGQFLFRSISG